MNLYNPFFIIGTLLLLTIACNSQQTKVANTGLTDTKEMIQRGAEFDYNTKAMNIEGLHKKMKSVAALETTVAGEVEKVCLKKGCWMTIKNPEGDPMRVTFKDYAFFMPMDIHNKQVIFKGKAYQDTTSVDMLRHYAEDEAICRYLSLYKVKKTCGRRVNCNHEKLNSTLGEIRNFAAFSVITTKANILDRRQAVNEAAKSPI